MKPLPPNVIEAANAKSNHIGIIKKKKVKIRKYVKIRKEV